MGKSKAENRHLSNMNLVKIFFNYSSCIVHLGLTPRDLSGKLPDFFINILEINNQHNSIYDPPRTALKPYSAMCKLNGRTGYHTVHLPLQNIPLTTANRTPRLAFLFAKPGHLVDPCRSIM